MENTDGWTPKELFYSEHRKLSEKASSELIDIVSNLLVVGTLIMTLGMTGALTIRNIDAKKTPFLEPKIWYSIFILSVGFGVSSCALSMLLFTSVMIPSIIKTNVGFFFSRLIRSMMGCLLLYASLAIMGSASIISGAVLVYGFLPNWTFHVIAAFIGIPAILSCHIFYHSLQYAKHVMLAFCEEAAMGILSRMRIKWVPFYLPY
ncbi:uncharacterized protein LOC133284469 [Gastrolobium bilobum]|uniref:uncharacterized protein LOC133284469 n=1 Tax=Gastrolobium bilobum TaxID=150636 RepID=UPI002AB2F3CB|nr:uncharacterized protein LOC133284469 [Gastrolobium bilobum]